MNKPLDSFILTIRDQKVILDADLSEIYGVSTKRLNEQVKRNANRFPSDFIFKLTAEEWANLKSQVATSSLENADVESDTRTRSQIATLKTPRGQHRKYLPYAFTESAALPAQTADRVSTKIN